MKKDPYNFKDRFDKWVISIKGKEKIENLNKVHSQLLRSFITDFSLGLNISNQSKKGKRSYARLLHYRHKLSLIIRQLESRGIKDITQAKDKDLHKIFSDMREGKIRTSTGSVYRSTGDYAKAIKAFWHWHIKVMKKRGEAVIDITEDLDTRGEKPKFVYFTQADCEKIIDKSSYDLKPILALAFDAGVRVTEMFNIKISDFLNDFKELDLRQEPSKTFARRIKLMLCSAQIKTYIRSLGLQPDDYFCRKHPSVINKELRILGKEILTAEQTKFKNLTLYDFRHSSACFWLPRYKSESALKYRFGWKKSDMIHYYTEFLGMKDTISNDDMYIDLTKTELEKNMSAVEKENKKMWHWLDQLTRMFMTLLETMPKVQHEKLGPTFQMQLKEIYALKKG